MKRIIFLSLALGIVLAGCTIGVPKVTVITPVQAQQKAEQFINANYMKAPDTATVENVVLENGLYKFTVKLPDGKSVDSYMSTDGAKIFPQAVDLATSTAATTATTTPADNTAAAAAQPAATVAVKSAKPKVELFVMSYCPYGTQIEKGILPVLATLGSKIDYSLRFVSYSMHGEKEIKENTVQYCIQKEQPTKLNSYLTCFLQASDSASCLKSTGVDQGKVDACYAAADKQFQITANSKDTSSSYPPFIIDKGLNDKYAVQGSPTLVINGAQVEAGRDPASLLKVICSAFTKAPAECSKQLASATPSPGFGAGTDTSGTPAAGCATPQQ